MKKSEDIYKWHCVICEKEMKIDNPGSLDPATWPNIEGGTFSISFGWPSSYDDMDFCDCYNNHKEWQGCICDEYFEVKKHLMRRVKETRLENKWEIISEKD